MQWHLWNALGSHSKTPRRAPYKGRPQVGGWNRMTRETCWWDVSWQWLPVKTISCSKTSWSSLTHVRVFHQTLAQSLRDSKIQFVVEDAWPVRESFNNSVGRGYDNFVPREVNKTTPSGDRNACSSTWPASLPRIKLFLPVG